MENNRLNFRAWVPVSYYDENDDDRDAQKNQLRPDSLYICDFLHAVAFLPGFILFLLLRRFQRLVKQISDTAIIQL